jgi:adenine-specific DNA-methyltransferase
MHRLLIEGIGHTRLNTRQIFGVVITKNKDDVVSNTKLNGKYKKFFEGRDIGRYRINFADKYLLYERSKLHRPRIPEIFESREKILVQRISGGRRPLKAAYDNEQYYNKESINNIILSDRNFDAKYILALLN